MSNYIPNGQKKNKIFKKREIELTHAIKHEYSRERIVKAAEILREAKLQVINVQSFKSKNVSFEESQARKEINLEKWESLSVDEIIRMYEK